MSSIQWLIRYWAGLVTLVLLIPALAVANFYLDSWVSKDQNEVLSAQTEVVPTFTGQEIFDAVNTYQKENGVKELKLDENLCNNLAQRFLDIKTGLDEDVAHKGFDEWYGKYVEPLGYSVNEDYAWGSTPQGVIKTWEGSPGHRLSILNPQNTLGCSYAAEGHAIIVLGYKPTLPTSRSSYRDEVVSTSPASQAVDNTLTTTTPLSTNKPDQNEYFG